MFFSLIRAPNQFSPKSKVVDLLSLYNFYFGQISCSHMKFGVLGGQTLLKIISNEFNSVTGLSSEAVRAPIPRPRVVAGDSTRRRAGDPRPPRSRARPYPLSQSRVRFPLSFSFLARGSSRARAGHRRRPRRPSSPPCLDSPRPEPHNFALYLLCLIPCPFEPTPGRIDLQSTCLTGRHCLATPELRPSVDLPLSALLRPN